MKKLKIASLALTLLIAGSGLFTAQAQAIDAEMAKKIAGFSEDIAAHPDLIDSYIYRGNIYLRVNKLAEAFADANKALTLNAKNLDALLLRGEIKTQRKDYDGAIADITAAIDSTYRPRARDYFARGEAYEKKGDLQKAYVDYKKAVDIYQYSDNYIDAVSRVESLLKKQNVDLAAPELSFTSAENRKKADAAYNEADKFIKKLEWQAAVDSYTKAIALDPQFASAFAGRAELYGSSLNQYDKALADYAEAIRLKPDYHNAYAARGDLYYINNKPDLALADYNEALRIYPNNTDALLGRGRVYSRLKRFDNSIADWEKYLSVYPNSPNAAQVRSYIATDRQAIASSAPANGRNTSASTTTTVDRSSDLYKNLSNEASKFNLITVEAGKLMDERNQLVTELKTAKTVTRGIEIIDRMDVVAKQILAYSPEAFKFLNSWQQTPKIIQSKEWWNSIVTTAKKDLEYVASIETANQTSTGTATAKKANAEPESELDKFLREKGIVISDEEKAKNKKAAAQMVEGMLKDNNPDKINDALKNMKSRTPAENKMYELVFRESDVKEKYRAFKAAYAKTSDVKQQLVLLDRIKNEYQTALTELEDAEKQYPNISPDDKKLLTEIKTGYAQSLSLINGMIAEKKPTTAKSGEVSQSGINQSNKQNPTVTSPTDEVARYVSDLKRTMTNAGYRVVSEGVADKARAFANGSSSRLPINASSNLHFVLFVITDDPTYDTFFYLNGQFMNTPVRMSGYYVKSPLVKKLSDTHSLFSFNMGFNNENRSVAAEFRGDKPGKVNYILMQLPENPQ